MPGKKDQPNIEDLGNGKHRIRWRFKDVKGKWRSRQRDIRGSFKDAERELNRIKNELYQNTYIDKSRITVSEQVEEWYNFHQTEIEEKTRTRYEQSIKLHIIPNVGNIQLQKFGVLDIQNLYKLLSAGGRRDGKDGGLSKGTLHWIHTTLNQAMEDAVIKERIHENPVKKVKAPKGADPGDKINPLNEEQTRIFLEHAKNDRHYRLWLTFLGTGCRPEELLGLKRMRVNFENKTVTISEVAICNKQGKMVPKPIPKTKQSRRTIMISDAVVDALKLHLEEQDAWKEKIGPKLYKDKGLIFASETGSYLNPSNLASRHFKPILRAAGLPDIRPYDLRHSHATLLFLQCRDMELVSKRLGHDDVAFTWKTYYHLLPGVEDEAVAKFDGVLTGKLFVPEPQPDKASEDAPGDACVNSCVTNNVIPFPTGALPKAKSRNRLRDKDSDWS